MQKKPLYKPNSYTIPAYKLLDGLSRTDKELYAQFGPMALPEFDVDGKTTRRYSVFQYVHQVATTSDRQIIYDAEERVQMLYQCLLESLAQGDASVFREIADAIEAVHRGLNETPYLTYPHAILQAHRIPESYKRSPDQSYTPSPNSYMIWGPDLLPTASQVLMKMGRNPLCESAKRSLLRACAALKLKLSPAKSGPRFKK